MTQTPAIQVFDITDISKPTVSALISHYHVTN